MDIKNTLNYIKIAIDAAIDHFISEDQLRFYSNRKIGRNPVPVIRQLNSVNNSSNSFYVSVIFSAFAVESYINFYGVKRISNDLFKKTLEKLSISKKWIIVTELVTKKMMDTGAEPYQSIDRLVKKRNELVHDMPVIIDDPKIYKKAGKKSKLDIRQSFDTILKINSYMNSIDPQYKYMPIITPKLIEKWNNWKEMREAFIPEKGMPFEGVRFPSLTVYKSIMVSKFIDIDFDNVFIEKGSNIIKLKK